MVAQSIDAFEMTMSNTIHGHGDRYAPSQRIIAMLDHEFEILVRRLGPFTIIIPPLRGSID